MRPDGGGVLFHKLAGGEGDVCAAGHHPRHHAHALREHDRTLGGGFPQCAREVPGRQRQDVGQRYKVRRVRVVDDSAVPARRGGADTVVHVMTRKLTGGSRPALEPPDYAPARTRGVYLHYAHRVLGVGLNVAEILAAARGDEIFPRERPVSHAHAHPLAGGAEKRRALGNFFGPQTVSEVAAVALVPALEPAVAAHADESPHGFYIENAHIYPLSESTSRS